jgi:1,2-phenylacetyl-CoA epoxidase PaaB subunit
MNRWRVFVDGKHSGRPFRSVMAPDEDSARQKAIDFYQIEPTLLRVVAIKSDSAKPKPRDQLDDLWHRRPESLFR